MPEVTPTTEVSVIIVNYNAGRHLLRCLSALSEQEFRDFEIIMVDNASDDGSLEQALALETGIALKVIRPQKNIGFAAGCNRGADQSEGRWLAFLNPDAFPAPDWLSKVMQGIETHPQTVSFGSCQLMDRDPGRLDGAGDAYFFAGFPWRGGYGHPSGSRPSDGMTFSACAAASIIRRDIFQDLGGFDERFFCYCEDVDLGFRLLLTGHYTVQLSDAVVRHVGSISLGASSPRARYFGARNRVWTLIKNMPGPLLLLTIPAHVAVLLLLSIVYLGQPQGLAGIGATWRGVVHALVKLRPILADRRMVQGTRTTSLRDITYALTWSPLIFLRRQADIRPVS